MSATEHWDHIYQTKRAEEVSWYAPHLNRSLSFIAEAAPDKSARIIDVGGGESTLVDDLLDQGYTAVSVLDISPAALSAVQARLGARKSAVNWLVGDAAAVALPEQHFDVWHDRAVFHFLTEPGQRAAYVAQVKKSVKHGGHVIVATFGPNGPLKCSGLDVVRYSHDALHAQFGSAFELIRHAEENHLTPSGVVQQFVYCYFRLCAFPC
jgi:SAM-dependent methyltransferase